MPDLLKLMFSHLHHRQASLSPWAKNWLGPLSDRLREMLDTGARSAWGRSLCSGGGGRTGAAAGGSTRAGPGILRQGSAGVEPHDGPHRSAPDRPPSAAAVRLEWPKRGARQVHLLPYVRRVRHRRPARIRSRIPLSSGPSAIKSSAMWPAMPPRPRRGNGKIGKARPTRRGLQPQRASAAGPARGGGGTTKLNRRPGQNTGRPANLLRRRHQDKQQGVQGKLDRLQAPSRRRGRANSRSAASSHPPRCTTASPRPRIPAQTGPFKTLDKKPIRDQIGPGQFVIRSTVSLLHNAKIGGLRSEYGAYSPIGLPYLVRPLPITVFSNSHRARGIRDVMGSGLISPTTQGSPRSP